MTSSETNSLNVTPTQLPQNDVICEPVFNHENLLFGLVPAFQVIVNIIAIVAVARKRSTLRHNFVYVYVMNTLTANTLLGIFSFYKILNDNLAVERKWNSDAPFSWNATEDKTRMNWWAFRDGHVITLFLAMSGSICALCYGIRESAYFVGKVANKSLQNRRSPQSALKMSAIIVLNWSLPLALDLATALGWNCAHNCKCIPVQYENNIWPCAQEEREDCSMLISTQKKLFVVIVAFCWIIEAIMMIWLNLAAIKKYKTITNSGPFKQANNMPRISSFDEGVSGCSGEHNENIQNKGTTDEATGEMKQDDLNIESSCNSEINAQDRGPSTTKYLCFSSCPDLPRLNHNIKLLLSLSSLFILCTLPAIIIGFVDEITNSILFNYAATSVTFMFGFIYCIASPFVLIYYMAGLRASVNHLILRCSCCITTTTTNQMNVTESSFA